MSLPIMQTAIYEMKIPSTGVSVKFRPFLVKEEKALMIAQQSEDTGVMLDTLKSIIQACTFNKLDVSKLAMFDIEYIFIKLRAKSVGEISELVFSCKQCNDPKGQMKVSIDLMAIEVNFDPAHTKDIPLFESVGVKMKYPDLSLINKMKNVEADNINAIFELITASIEYVYDADKIYMASEQTTEELEDFINNLTQDQFSKIQNFFETMPKLEQKIEFDCPVCKFHHTQVIQGIDDFF